MSEEEETEHHELEHNLQKMEEMLQEYVEQARTAAALLEKDPENPERIKESKTAADMVKHAQGVVQSARADLEKLKSTREPSTPTAQVSTSSYAALEPPTKGGDKVSLRGIFRWIWFFVFGTIGAIFALWFVMNVWPGPEIQVRWQTDIEPVLPCFMVEQGETCPISGSGTETTEPDFGQYSPPPGSGLNWNCAGPAVYDQANGTVTHDADLCVDP